MMSRDKLLLLNKHKRNRRLLSPKARRLSLRMRRVATKVVTKKASRKLMIVPRRLVVLVVESAAEAEAVAVAVAVTAVAVVVVKAAVEAVDVVVLELPRLPVKAKLRLKELSVVAVVVVKAAVEAV